MDNKFCIFILSHGRPNNIVTLKTIKEAGYTGDWRIIIDDEDKTAQQYFKKYGRKKVIQFCKREAEKTTDTMDSIKERRCVVFARNECFKIAERLGIRYFLVLDDDYTSFQFRLIEGNKLKGVKVNRKMDAICSAFVEFLSNTPTTTIAMAQGGDFIGGAGGKYAEKNTLTRKAMNSFFCDTKKPFKFLGRINEDTNAYVNEGMRGNLFFTATQIMLCQGITQQNDGGLTDIYKSLGTFVKSFYTVMISPSSVCVRMMGDNHYRLHHNISWRNTVPLILKETLKKL